MTPEQQKEEISRAYLQAVAASCGFTLGHWSQDQSCIDATIGAAGVLGGGTIAEPKLDIQLKCTANQELLRENSVALQLPRVQYDRLIARASSPKMLVVLVLPPVESEWIIHSTDHLALRRCAYYRVTTGLPPITTGSTVLHVPFANVFSPTSVLALLTRISRGEPV